jgi:hypothetical protein
MPTKSPRALNSARSALQPRLDFEAFLTKLKSAKERANAQQHLDTIRGDAEHPHHAKIWQRLVSTLLTLAPELPRFGSQRAVQFSVPDGRYKLQVFALQDGDNNTAVHVYLPDISTTANAAGLVRPGKGGERAFLTPAPGQILPVDEIADTGGEQRLPDFVRPMLGWGKKALHLALPLNATEAQLTAVEDLCALAAVEWRTAAPKA